MPHLDQMVQHEGGDAGLAPLGMAEDEGDVGLVVLDVRHHERKANHQLPMEYQMLLFIQFFNEQKFQEINKVIFLRTPLSSYEDSNTRVVNYYFPNISYYV